MQPVEKAQALAQELNLPFHDLTGFKLEAETLSLLPVEWMHRYTCLPLGLKGNQLELAFADPNLPDDLEKLELVTRRRISLIAAPKDRIEEILKESESSQQVLQDAGSDFRSSMLGEQAGDDVLDINRLVDDGSPLVRLVDTIIFNALERRASDIHIETEVDRVVRGR